MRFKVGDVCVIIDAPNLLSEWHRQAIGEQVCIHSIHKSPFNIDDKMLYWVDTKSHKELGYYVEHLRLKRPPSWDTWIYDTSTIPHDQQETV